LNSNGAGNAQSLLLSPRQTGAWRAETIAHLRSEIDRMQGDTRVQERWIRQELGYVKPGELLYLFPGDRAADFAFLHDRHLDPGAQP